MAKNANLLEAKKTKNDEFYTQLSDIEAELPYYSSQLKGKSILCNCDDPEQSNFWRYFYENFDNLELKSLTATHYSPGGSAFKLEIKRDGEGKRLPQIKTILSGTGDFRSQECIELLIACDVVITNPPFSLFREYLLQLMEYGKSFLIIGNQNMLVSRVVFPFVMDDRLWIGYNKPKQFLTPDGGVRSFGNIIWYTNIDIKKRHEPIPMPGRYQEKTSKYPTYDNYDGINIDRLTDIPEDFYGVMGVPITYLDKHCPEQFRIVGAGTSPEFFTPTKKYTGTLRHNLDGTAIKQHIAINQTVTLAVDEKPRGLYYTAENSNKYLVSPYCRILIQRILQ